MRVIKHSALRLASCIATALLGLATPAVTQASTACDLGGNEDDATFDQMVTTDLICGARLSINVAPPADVTGSGRLTLIAPLVSIENGFNATGFRVITPRMTNFSNLTPVTIIDTTVVSSTINVTGVGAYLSDVDVQTFITHTYSADLDLTIESPSGTVVTLSTDNGDEFDDVFDGTTWNDSANSTGQVPYISNPGMVTDSEYTDGVTLSPLTPEEPLAAFVGEDPNGIWTLTIDDDAGGDSGTLNNWRMRVTTLSTAPSLVTNNFENTTPVPIVDETAVTSTINVTGVGTYLSDVDVQTFITHAYSSDLDFTIESPQGTVVTLSTDNGDKFEDVFNGTVWNDSANPTGQVPYTFNLGIVTDTVYTDFVTLSPLTPEEPLAAFVGEDPNGIWTLTIYDDAIPDIGNLNSWNLDITTVE